MKYFYPKVFEKAKVITAHANERMKKKKEL
jgi:hypothetical protein